MVKTDARAAGLDNYKTVQTGRVPATKDVPIDTFRSLLEEVSPHLSYDRRYQWDANINGVLVRYIGNSRHQYTFWQENWWPGPNDGSVVPHGKIFSVQGVPEHDSDVLASTSSPQGDGLAAPHAYYCPALNQALFLNTEYYGQCKSWALGMAAVELEDKFNTHSIHGACATYKGKGVVIVAPTGTGKTTQVNRLFQTPHGKVVGDDWVYIQHPPTLQDADAFDYVVTQPERSLYVRTENALNEPWLGEIFDRCLLENVVTQRGRCHHEDGEPCAFDQGGAKCFWGFGNSRAMLPREWMLGPQKVADEAPMNLIVLLRRDDESEAEVWLDPEEAVEVLREGRYQIRPGAGPKETWGTYGEEPWYNPYLLKPDHEKQAEFFRREVEATACVLLNTGLASETIERTHERIKKALDNV